MVPPATPPPIAKANPRTGRQSRRRRRPTCRRQRRPSRRRRRFRHACDAGDDSGPGKHRRLDGTFSVDHPSRARPSPIERIISRSGFGTLLTGHTCGSSADRCGLRFVARCRILADRYVSAAHSRENRRIYGRFGFEPLAEPTALWLWSNAVSVIDLRRSTSESFLGSPMSATSALR